MFTRQATVVAILGMIRAACSAGAAPTASPQARPQPIPSAAVAGQGEPDPHDRGAHPDARGHP